MKFKFGPVVLAIFSDLSIRHVCTLKYTDMRKALIAAFILLAAFANAQKSPKNVIIMIGDGMGFNTVSLQILDSKGTSNFERFNSIGASKTYLANGNITDSGAGGTALATGVKTYSGAIGVDVNKQSKPNLMEVATKNKIATGIVVTCDLTHATPASFSAHQPSRKMTQEIADDMSKSNIDLLVGGGLNNFTKRKDGRNLVDELKGKGYSYYSDTASFFSSNTQKSLVIVADEHLKQADKGRGNFLPRAVEKSINLLDQNKKGFIMMVEGSQIDWAEHGNNTEYLRAEMQDFDKAIGVALDFAKKDGNTLVIVLADHDTGGVTLPPHDASGVSEDYGSFVVKYSTTAHAATLIPVFAYGPGAEKFQGIYENNEVFHKIMSLKGWKK